MAGAAAAAPISSPSPRSRGEADLGLSTSPVRARPKPRSKPSPYRKAVERRANDDVGIGIDLLPHAARGGLVDLIESWVFAARDRQKQAFCASERDVIEQRIRDGFLGSQRGLRSPEASPVPIMAEPIRSARTHVSEIEIDQAFFDDEVDDARDTGIEHLVCHQRTPPRRWSSRWRCGTGSEFGMTISVSTLVAQLGDADLCDARAPARLEQEKGLVRGDGRVGSLAERAITAAAPVRFRRPCRGDEHHMRAFDL